MDERGREGPEAALSAGALAELEAVGLTPGGTAVAGIARVSGRGVVPRRPMSAPDVLNEAYDYARPSSFSRGLRVELPGAAMLFLSGTASVDERGRSIHPGDFRAQCLRALRNLTRLLATESASWHDVVRTTCYLRDIDRDYDAFNEIRTLFLRRAGIDPLPASTAIEARICRADLLVEIEAIAMIPKG